MPEKRYHNRRGVVLSSDPMEFAQQQQDYLAWSQAVPEDIADVIDPFDPYFDDILVYIRMFRCLGGLNIHDRGTLELIVAAARNNAAASEHGSPMMGSIESAEYLSKPRAREFAETVAVVYYMRIGNRCKIGYSAHLETRLKAVNPEELLATEPGGPRLERERHDQFSRLRVYSEWFRYEDELVDHVTALQGRSAA